MQYKNTLQWVHVNARNVTTQDATKTINYVGVLEELSMQFPS